MLLEASRAAPPAAAGSARGGALKFASSLVRHAEYLLRWTPDADRAAQAQALRVELVDAMRRIGDNRDLGDLIQRTSASAEAGLIWHWTHGPNPPNIAVRFEPKRAGSAPWWTTETVAILVLGVFVLSWLPGGPVWFARLWPEQLAGLALLGCAAWGWSVVAVALLALALLGRSAALIAWLHRWSTTPTEATSASSS
jgi:hypothetical protein